MAEPLTLVPPSDRERVAESMMAAAESVLNFLNAKSGRKFPARTPRGQPTSAALLIFDRIRDGWSVEDMRSVVALKWRQVRTDKDKHYFRPETIFRKANFESGVGELE